MKRRSRPPQRLWDGRLKPFYKLLHLDQFTQDLPPPETEDDFEDRWWDFIDLIEDDFGHKY